MKYLKIQFTLREIPIGYSWRGVDEYESVLKKITKKYNIENNVTFTGFLDGDSSKIISEFDLLAMPTVDFEGFGYSMAEAMSVKVPIIASSVGAIPEIIDHKINGVLISPGNLREWKENLEILISNNEFRKILP